MTLNEIATQSYINARKREQNGANINTGAMAMLKHTATEVIEATEAYMAYNFCSVDYSALRKSAFASELADIICCVAIIAKAEDIDLDKAVAGCLRKNQAMAEGKGDKK